MQHRNTVLDFNHALVDNKGDIAPIIKNTMNEGILISGPIGKEIGIDGMIAATELWFSAFPDAAVENLEVSCNDDTAVMVWNMKATHQNAFCGVEATGNTVYYNGISIYRFDENGKIAELGYKTDMLTIYKQMGLTLEKDPFADPGIIKRDYAFLLKTLSQFGEETQVLTKPEVMCLCLLLFDHSEQEISHMLNLSLRDIQAKICKALEKVHCSNQKQLVEQVAAKGLMPIFRDFYHTLRAPKTPGQ